MVTFHSQHSHADCCLNILYSCRYWNKSGFNRISADVSSKHASVYLHTRFYVSTYTPHQIYPSRTSHHYPTHLLFISTHKDLAGPFISDWTRSQASAPSFLPSAVELMAEVVFTPSLSTCQAVNAAVEEMDVMLRLMCWTGSDNKA